MDIKEVATHLVDYLQSDTAAHDERPNQRHERDDRRARVVEALFLRAELYAVLRYMIEYQHDIPEYNSRSRLVAYIRQDLDALTALEVGLLAARAVQQLRSNQSPKDPIRRALTRLGVPQVDWVGSFSISANNPWVELLCMLPRELHAPHAHTEVLR